MIKIYKTVLQKQKQEKNKHKKKTRIKQEIKKVSVKGLNFIWSTFL